MTKLDPKEFKCSGNCKDCPISVYDSNKDGVYCLLDIFKTLLGKEIPKEIPQQGGNGETKKEEPQETTQTITPDLKKVLQERFPKASEKQLNYCYGLLKRTRIKDKEGLIKKWKNDSISTMIDWLKSTSRRGNK